MCNIETICRLCGTSEGIKVNILDHRRLYVSIIHQLLPVKVDERDPWSKLICHRCAFKLEDFCQFRESCVKTDAYLKTQVSWEQPVNSQHIPAEPQNGQMKQEKTGQEEKDWLSSTPPPLSPQIKPETEDVLPSEPPLLSPATAPAPCAQVQANNSQHTSAIKQAPPPTSYPLADMVFVNSDLDSSYVAEEPVEEDYSDSTADDCCMGFRGSGVSEEVGVNTETETRKTGSRKHKNTSDSAQVSKKNKMRSKDRSRSHRTNKVNSVKSVLASVNSEDCSKSGTKSNKCEPQHCVRTKAANVNDDMLHLKSHAKADTLKKKLMRKPGPKSKVGSRDDNSESDESDVVFVLHKPPNSVLDVIDMTNVSDSPEEVVDESDPEEGLAPNLLLTRIPGIGNIFTCCHCEDTFTSKRRIQSHLSKCKVFNSSSPEEQVPGGKTAEGKTSGKETCKNMVPEAMPSENRASEKGASDNTASENEGGSGRGGSSESTLSPSFAELPRIRHLRQGAATFGKDRSSQDKVPANSEPYRCDICGLTFSRLVTLISHKNGHLYRMNDGGGGGDDDDDEDDYYDDDYSCVKKKKKPVAKDS